MKPIFLAAVDSFVLDIINLSPFSFSIILFNKQLEYEIYSLEIYINNDHFICNSKL